MKMHDFKNHCVRGSQVPSLHCVQAFSGVVSKFPNELVAEMRWAICDLLSIKAETYQIIETPFISISEFPFSFSRHEVRTAGAEL